MDDAAIDAATHQHALRGLARLNTASGIVRTVEGELRRRFGSQPLSVLDVAAGSGDLAVKLAKRYEKETGVNSIPRVSRTFSLEKEDLLKAE